MVAKPPKGVPLFPRAEGAVVWFSNEHSEFGLFSLGRSPVLKVLLISKTSILLIGSLRSPPPIRLRRTSPYSGGRINRR